MNPAIRIILTEPRLMPLHPSVVQAAYFPSVTRVLESPKPKPKPPKRHEWLAFLIFVTAICMAPFVAHLLRAL